MEDGSHMTKKIWGLTLEIICLLTREPLPPAMSGDHVTITVAPPPSLTPERFTMQKILEVTKKITELLTGEMGSPFDLNIVEIKEEEEEEPVMGESEYSGEDGDLCGDMKIESSTMTVGKSARGEYGDGVEEPGVKSDEWCIEEERFPVTGAAGPFMKRNTVEHPNISSDYKTEEGDITADSPAGNQIALDLHPDHHSADPSSHLAGNWGCFPDDSHLVPHHTAEKEEFTSHQRKRTGEKPYYCLECGKCFPFKSALKAHKRVHTGEKPYNCSECGKCFSSKSNLITHERVHTGEKPYSCSECGKCFSHKPDLIKHESLHTGVKPYSCSICGNCFSQKPDLIKHVRYHTGERPYSCSVCRKCFVEKSHLINHERVHTGEKPYTCSECGKCFSQKSNLIKHERVHTGEKPYSCSECGKCFSQKSDLLKHERVHTGEKPYSCSECGKCFSVRAALINHEKKNHTREELPY